ncbi:MAG: corrinoid methyltransferase [Chloroflexota bacterium]|nr:MAG: corrinoid methyltransferase [Chloroflexota bacterium]
MDSILQDIYNSVLEGRAKVAPVKVQEALDSGISAVQILNEGMIRAMAEVGRLYEEGEYFVPEMLIAARAMKEGLAVLRPHLLRADVKSVGKVAAGTVQGDLHDIGKNLVALMLEGAGFEIVDLGVDVSAERFIAAVQEHNVDIIAMSALLTTTMSHMKDTVEALKAAGLRDKVKVMIGGAPVTQSYANEVGADGYAPDASQAVALAKSLIA